ncbi:MAG: hypothetical protein COV36_06085 [Alphaproteobacteria bacterium CG11_big_fil_rev_8_21_14_0_20_44_7]|nr:MAG: hypothetical protein COV36_06085 [Alphaproteobacteria bacterium CG11_big_fil_rev_8_21_14_0_20_44_7]
MAAPRRKPLALLVDDEPLNRALAKINMKSLEFEIIEASDGREALEILAERGTEIGLILTDQNMKDKDGTGMNGDEMLRIAKGRGLLRENGQTRIMLSTDEEVCSQVTAEGLAHAFLDKVSVRSPGKLAEAVNEALAKNGQDTTPSAQSRG